MALVRHGCNAMLISIDQLLDKSEVQSFRAQLAQCEWEDGARSAGTLAQSVKRNQQLNDAHPTAQALGNIILRKLAQHPTFISAALPRRIYPPKFNRYAGGGTYGAHVDSALMGLPNGHEQMRTDVSATLFLSEPDEYTGGELEIEGHFGVQTVKLAAGDMVLYPSSSLHRVTPVTQGARVASFFWIESHVADDSQRTLLFDLDQSIQHVTAQLGGQQDAVLGLTGVYHNLLRRWVQ
jgi:PKHD-type hydroxylase